MQDPTGHEVDFSSYFDPDFHDPEDETPSPDVPESPDPELEDDSGTRGEPSDYQDEPENIEPEEAFPIDSEDF